VALDPQLLGELRRAVRGELLRDEPLAPYTTLRIGGPAELLLLPADEAALVAACRLLRAAAVSCRVLGNGSNLLVPDEGVAGAVVRTQPACQWVRFGGEEVEAGAGYPVQRLLNDCARRGLTGLEGLSGVPGTVGGAVVMNAGTAAGETAGALRAVRLLLPDGTVAERAAEALGFGYRRSNLQDGEAIVLAARFRLRPGDAAAIRRDLAERARRRRATQPTELPSAGSIWTNPPGDHAGRLVEAAGCKGLRVGDAQVSPKHANFIVNLGAARAADVIALMAAVRRRVRAAFGVQLEPEVRWLPGQKAFLRLLAAAEAAAG
jgi:UDP-N-acetylmuramate dehydrogenase